MEKPTPQKEHKWLEQLLGEWVWESEDHMSPGEAPRIVTGTEVVHSIGELWVQAILNMHSGPPGCAPSVSQMTLGYDTQKGRFVGTFITSMMAFLWVYDGALDEGGKKLVLSASGPSFDPAEAGKLVPYQDVIEIIGTDQRTLTSYLQKDGEWVQFMEASYRRKV